MYMSFRRWNPDHADDRDILYFHTSHVMFSFNRVHIIGYQTQPISVRQTPTGSTVTDLNLVVPYRFRAENGEMLDGKGFHTVTLWGPMADVAGKYAKAGSQMFISGRLQTDSWDDEKTGEKRSKTKIIGMDMILLDPKEGMPNPPAGSENLLGCINRADIVGNATRDPEMRTTTSGQQVLTFGVATNEKWKDKSSGQDRERVEFHNVVVWGKMAEDVARGIKKGSKVFVSGRVQTRSWETKEGSKRYTTEIIAESVSLLGTKNPAISASVQADAGSYSTGPSESFSQEPVMAASAPEIPDIQYASEVKAEDLPF